jgi:hypothetical protein
MPHALIRTRIAQPLSEMAREPMPLVESAQGQETGITADLPAGKIRADGLMAVEGEQLWYTVCHASDAPKGDAGFTKPSVHQPFRASFLFSLAKSWIIQPRANTSDCVFPLTFIVATSCE